MRGVMLTVMRANEAAVAFYTRMGYAEHETSPGMADPDERTGYIILHKQLKPRRTAAAASAGAAAAAGGAKDGALGAGPGTGVASKSRGAQAK
jgi:hypothetical protein